MKTYLLLLVGILGFASARAQGSVASPGSELRRLPATAAPYLLPPGATWATSDSAYLVSPARLRFYQRLHRHVLDTTAEEVCSARVASYARRLRVAQRAYDRLWREYRTADSVATGTLRQTQHSLARLDASLVYARTTLGHTTEQLHTLEAQLRRAERQARRRRWAYGLSGIGIGLLVGAVVW